MVYYERERVKNPTNDISLWIRDLPEHPWGLYLLCHWHLAWLTLGCPVQLSLVNKQDGMWLSKEICVSTGSINSRVHFQDGQSVALGSRRNLPPGQTGTGSQGVLPSSAALSMATAQRSFSPFWLSCCLLLMPHEDGLSCPAAMGKKLSRLSGWAPRLAWGLLLVLL